MARIQFSELVTDIRGSVGNSVFQGNAQGTFLRKRAIPRNPSSSLQQTSRAKFAHLSGRWALLNSDQRQAWINSSLDFPFQNSLGQTKYRTGFQLFIYINSGFLKINGSELVMPPAPQGNPGMVFNSVAIFAEDISISQIVLNISWESLDYGFFLFASPLLSAGTTGATSRTMRYLGAFSDDYTETDFADLYKQIWGLTSNSVGRAVQFKVVPFSHISGQSYMPLVLTAIVQPAV